MHIQIYIFESMSKIRYVSVCVKKMNGATSGWWQVARGIPEGSVLGPVHFSIFSNGVDAGVECAISKLDVDTKLGHAVHDLEGQKTLQEKTR